MSLLGIAIRTSAAGVVLAWVLTPLVIRLAHRIGAVDHPGPRKVHSEPVPRIGGLAIFASFFGAIAFAAWLTGYTVKFPEGGFYWIALAAGAGCALLLGLVDDLFGLTFRAKFAVQILAASGAWAAGFRIGSVTVPLLGTTVDLGPLSFFVTVLWIVGITNAVNLIDGLDGLAAGSAVITTSTMAVMAISGERVAVTAICAALAGSLVGFLRFNFNPARIFLGDSGSMFLGFVLAVVSIYGTQKGPAAVAVLAPLLVLGLPILDTSLAITRRLLRLGRNASRSEAVFRYALRNATIVFLPDREHLHHRLLEMGLSHRAAVMSLYAVGAVLAVFALAQVSFASLRIGLLLLGTLAGLMLAGILGYHWLRTRRVTRNGETIIPPVVGSTRGIAEDRR